ncbi:MAG: NADH:ubiquinone oxidoreductase subunit NDUFA12 [Rickettsiaceae bacterium]|nr:NADH:ubiquinone oxidoreductase subunit NDUFA12 [Rickettsiaceae bacterium]
MSIINKIWLKIFAKKVGEDRFGNKYYLGNNTNYLGQKKRYVIFNGIEESSKVPPVWHAWLHYMSDVTPSDSTENNYSWQQDHLPNLTGTKYAYNPARSDKNVKYANYSKWIPK